MELNPEQRKAVDHFEGACIVTATPGSGKTRVLTSRVVSLIKDKDIPSRNILCLTFTNKAAGEMKERVVDSLPEEGKSVWISTFHRLCLAVLRKYGHRVGLSPDFTIYNSKDQNELLEKISRMHGYSYDNNIIYGMAKAVNDFREDVVDFDQHVQELGKIEIDIVKEYLKTLDDIQAVDFSGMLYKTWKCLKDNADVVNSLSDRFRFILVDEMQDTNTIQYDIIRFIAKAYGNLFVVGDKNQAIFSFRNARPENINRLYEDFDHVTEIFLPRNYRSTKHILAAAQRLIRHNDNAKNVELISERGAGNYVNVMPCKNPEAEADWVVNNIKDLKHSEKYKWKDFAILYRMNGFSRSPEIALRAAEIPYKISGGFSFFDRSEVKTTLAYLSLLSNPYDTIAFSRAISLPKRSVGAVVVGKIERLCQDKEISILEACKNTDKMGKVSSKAKENIDKFIKTIERCRELHADGMPLAQVSKKLLKDSGYYDFVKKQSELKKEDEDRFDNVEELLSSIADFESSRKSCTVSDYLQSIQLIMNDNPEDLGDDVVQLMTAHSSKGKEWKCVHVIGVESGVMPHYRSVQEGNIDEERRILYVSISRSKEHLKLSYCGWRRNRPATPSPFLNEIGIDGSW